MEFQRSSKQREVILEELKKFPSHPTAAVLYQVVRQQLPRISLGTVYRNLELLAKAEMIRKLDISGKEARYDGDLTQHYHLSCTECGRIDDISDPPAISINSHVVTQDGWDVAGHKLAFYGRCPGCREA
jgi:Fur family ferric uptake transcriptional regulator